MLRKRFRRKKQNDFYNTAGNWLREHTRDQRKFGILFAENITYGFRRNLLGLKTISLLFNILVLSICGVILYFRPPYFIQLPNIDEKLIIVSIAAVLHSVYMLFAVGAASVREASRAYGRQLILSCETLIKTVPVSTRSGSRSKADGGN